MRYRPEHKEATHRRIVETASQQFRANGFDGVGIAHLMGLLNLTHGGFYAHFSDKETLVTEASLFAMEQGLERMRRALEGHGFVAVLDYYLSIPHRDHAESGCPLPALSAEIARHPLASREQFTAKFLESLEVITEYMPGPTPERKREKVLFLLATLTGAVSLARAVSDPELSQSLLTTAREQLLAFIAGD